MHGLRILLSGAVVCLAIPGLASAETKTFEYTGGAQTWTVPPGVTSAKFDLYGAQGTTSCSESGRGAHVVGMVAVVPGDALRIIVGGQAGFNGGGAGASPGGGASDVRHGPGFGPEDRLLVAGGGGGEGGGNGTTCTYGLGGASGDAGQTGRSEGESGGGGGGGAGTSTAGGVGGSGGYGCPSEGPGGGAGGVGQGGEGAFSAGGGGGGYNGGGGGANGGVSFPPCSSTFYTGGGGGGGGGSSFTGGATGASVTDGVRAGNGLVEVTFDPPPSSGPAGAGAPGTSPPAPTSPSPANFSDSGSSVRVDREGRFRFGFSAGPSLTGEATFTSIGPVRVSRSRSNKKLLVLPTQPFTVPTTGIVTLKLKLSRQNLRILKINRKIAFDVLVTLRSDSGLGSSAVTQLTLKAPKPPRR